MLNSTQDESASTAAVIERFNDAVNQHDVERVMAAMTEDCVFENTSPFPDGTRFEGQAAVRSFWEAFFQSSPHAQINAEELFASGDRCTVRWIYQWVDANGQPAHIRGVDVFRVRGGKISEKLSYVKG